MQANTVVFIETPIFTGQVLDALDDEEYQELQQFLAAQPTAGAIIPGTGGARKLRWKNPTENKGKSGGFRTIYFYQDTEEHIYMLLLYTKSQKINLSQEQKKQLKAVIKNWN